MFRAALLIVALALFGAPSLAAEKMPENWKEQADSALDAQLKDPYSAVRKVTRGPRLDTFKIGPHPRWGWGVCYSVNAKNSYGAYTGEQLHLLVVTPLGPAFYIDPTDFLSAYAVAVAREQIERECNKPGDPLTALQPQGER